MLDAGFIESAQPLILCRGEIRGRRGRRLAPFPALLLVEQLSVRWQCSSSLAYWDQLSISVVMSTVRC